ncbi:MAG: CDP-diacylglycerol--glycerol-3-phosphate 3-phosphatidyltransferase [Alphaproteobacteria bacterium]|nr:CDP-diacylglycerol--glycerol-3-phosphate 3-phosphatidyltransferase [Alphaproteobacteria bacterium]
MHWNLPNILTIFRLAAAPLIVVLYLTLPRPVSDWAVLGLFTFAALTDYIDGYLARRWDQTSNFGKMMDPIADKAMTILALLLLTLMMSGLGIKIGGRYYDQSLLILIPAAAIMFREVGVSGLREFLGARASGLPVTTLAKWKTAAQMVAVMVLFSQGLFEHYYGVLAFGFTPEMAQDILQGREEDLLGLGWKYNGFIYSQAIGTGLLWLAGLLTLVTGFDYFRKALPYLKEDAK